MEMSLGKAGTAGSSTYAVPDEVGPLSAVVSQLPGHLDELAQAIDMLASKLSPVLTPEQLSEKSSAGDPALPRSVHTEQLEEHAARIDGLTNFVHALRGRVEL